MGFSATDPGFSERAGSDKRPFTLSNCNCYLTQEKVTISAFVSL